MRTSVLVVDNYDSFTYNLAQAIGTIGAEPVVVRNDAIDADGLTERSPDAVVISPGPGGPDGAGASPAITERCLRDGVPLLGVCLGLQVIGHVLGASVVRHPVMHGKTSLVHHDGSGIFTGLPDPFEAMRYHSLAIDPSTVPDALEVTATADDGTLMGIRHVAAPAWGVQFHPESVLTPWGRRLLENFVSCCRRR